MRCNVEDGNTAQPVLLAPGAPPRTYTAWLLVRSIVGQIQAEFDKMESILNRIDKKQQKKQQGARAEASSSRGPKPALPDEFKNESEHSKA